MGTKSSYVMNNQDATFNNNGNVINGNVNNQKIYIFVNSDKDFEQITGKNNYSKFYKKYILKFKELDDYALSLIYPDFINKSFEFSSNTLIFGKKIINWIYGIDEFPKKEIVEFYNDLKMDFEFNDNSIIVKRWNANIAYFSSDLQVASENYGKLYDELILRKDIPKWYIDDMCIDGRYILKQYEGTKNKCSYNSKYQKKLTSNEYKLSYPDIDRIKVEIFEDVLNHIFNNKNKSKYTTIYGVGLEKNFIQIQNLIFLTIFYGSITHLKLIRQLVANIMYMYADTFDDEDFYKLTLRMLFLSGEFKKYTNLYNKIKLQYSFVNSNYFIQEIINSRKSLFEFEKEKNDVFLFNIYGKYIDNDLYIKLETEMLELITIKESQKINLIENAFSAILSNIKRFKDIKTLLYKMKEYFDKDYCNFYHLFYNILNEINVEQLTELEFSRFQDIIDNLIDKENHNTYKLSSSIVKIKKRDSKILKYDKLIKDHSKHENIVYQIEFEKNEEEIVTSIIDVYKQRHEEREMQIGLCHDYNHDYQIGSSIFKPDVYNDNIKTIMINEYLPLSKSILLSKKEDIYEKIRHIKLLSYLYLVEKNESIRENIIDTIKKAQKIESFDYDYFNNIRKKNKVDLDINIIMFNVITQSIEYDDALFKYLEISIKKPENIEEVLKCILMLNEINVHKNDNVIDKLFLIFHIYYKINDIDIRNNVVIMSRVFLGTKYQKEIIGILENRVDEMIFEECKGYIQLIMDLTGSNRCKFKNIISKLKKNRNYYVKFMSSKYL